VTAPDMQYELDTARAKTPAERLRIVADLMEAHDRGEDVLRIAPSGETHEVHRFDSSSPTFSRLTDGALGWRYVTKRRPVLVIPALELFEAPMTEAPPIGSRYFNAHGFGGTLCAEHTWDGASIEMAWLAEGRLFRTKEAAERPGLHIRNELAKAVQS
jgi:hypothetical protein